MKNNKGFTLVELLAMLAVLAILMGVAIPNIVGMVGNQRLNVIRSDAIKMVDTAKIKLSKNKYIAKPKNNECVVFSLDYLNDNSNFDKGPNGGDYNQYDSFVLLTKVKATGYNSYNTWEYKYYVRLLEEKKENVYFGIKFIEIDKIKETTNSNITKINGDYGLTEGNPTDNANKVKNMTEVKGKSLCSAGVRYYTPNVYQCVRHHGSYFNAEGDLVGSEAECKATCPDGCPNG